MIRAEEDPPVCHMLIEAGSRFPQAVHRQRAPAGSGNRATSRCAL
jgi:hypothetical protein